MQTASFDSPVPARIAELLGWVLLLISGTVGLWRLEGIPRIQQFIGLGQLARDRLHQLQVDRDRGVRTVTVTTPTLRNYPIDDQIATWQSEVETANRVVGELEGPSNKRYQIQRLTLVLGLAALMVARGYGPVQGIICQLNR